MTRAPAQVIAGEICGDGEKPRTEALLRTKPVASAINTNECLLRQIVGVVFVREHPAEEMKHDGGVPVHQLGERVVLARRQTRHGGAVGRINVRCGHGAAGFGGHLALDLLVAPQGQLLHCGEVALPLTGWHDGGDLGEMPQHVGLAVGADFADIAQQLLDARVHGLSVGEGDGQLALLGRELLAISPAPRQISFVQRPDARQFGTA